MCYMILLSTTSERELSEFNTPLVRFSRELFPVSEESFLKYPNKWQLGSQYGCGCGFRHLERGNEDLGFSEPVDWYPEEQEDLEATHQAVDIFRSLLRDGAKLDCVDVWIGDGNPEQPALLQRGVDLSAISATSFRFFVGYCFEFTMET